MILKRRKLGRVVKLPSSGNDSRSTTMAPPIHLQLECTWAVQQHTDPQTLQQICLSLASKHQTDFWSGFVKVRVGCPEMGRSFLNPPQCGEQFHQEDWLKFPPQPCCRNSSIAVFDAEGTSRLLAPVCTHAAPPAA